MASEFDHILAQLESYCGYQERSRKEILNKMHKLEVPEDKQQEMLQCLQEQGFWDEQRFAEAYVRGKFRMNHWGRNLIRQGLREKGVPDSLSESALQSQISQDEYEDAIQGLVSKSPRPDSWEQRAKLFNQLLRKGFEHDIVSQALGNIREDREDQ